MEKVNVAEEWAKLRIDLYLGVSLMPDYLSKFGGDLEKVATSSRAHDDTSLLVNKTQPNHEQLE